MADIPCGSATLPVDDACPYEPPRDPCLIVIFGASGDLTARKIVPSLYRLFLHRYLPPSFAVLGCARSNFDDSGFRRRMQTAVQHAGHDMSRWDEFAERLHYQALQYEQEESYAALGRSMAEIEQRHATGTNRLYYLAIPPFIFERTITLLGRSGLAAEAPQAWTRIIVEKPFGSDLASARSLDRL